MARLFIATDVAVAVVERLALLQSELGRRLGDDSLVRWTAPENVHVTLKFLGDVDDALVPMLSATLSDLVRPLFPFEVRCCRLGGFPNLEQPQILWAGLDDKGAEVMGLLRQTIERDLGGLGFAPDPREFKPHLTLGRARGDVEAAGLHEFSDLDFGTSFVKDIVLFESRLTPDGATYHVRRRFPLGES